MVDKVLCVDDDIISQTITQLLLQKTGFAQHLLSANDGKEAIAVVEQLFSDVDGRPMNPPQLIFLDLNMPEVDGWGFLDHYMRHFADRLPGTKVVILSSTIDPADAVRARDYPVVIHFLHKPLQFDTLETLKEHPFVRQFFTA